MRPAQNQNQNQSNRMSLGGGRANRMSLGGARLAGGGARQSLAPSNR